MVAKAALGTLHLSTQKFFRQQHNRWRERARIRSAPSPAPSLGVCVFVLWPIGRSDARKMRAQNGAMIGERCQIRALNV
jgi:hypothetical protein